jgi:hypothetical protein
LKTVCGKNPPNNTASKFDARRLEFPAEITLQEIARLADRRQIALA